MKTNKNRILSFIIIVAMLISVLPFAAVTASAAAPTSPLVVDETGTYNLFNSGATSSYGREYSSSQGVDANPNSHSYSNSGYDIYGCSASGRDLTLGMGLSFQIVGEVTGRSTLTVYAYDIDEPSQEDEVYLVDETAGTRTKLDILKGRDSQWSTTTIDIAPSLFTNGHVYHFEDDVDFGGWWTWIRTVSVNIPISGGVTPTVPGVTSYDFSASIDGSGLVSTSLDLVTDADLTYYLEYTATLGGVQLGGTQGQTVSVTPSGANKAVSFSLESGASDGVYRIDVILKDSLGNTKYTYSVHAAYSRRVQYYAVNYNSNGGDTNIPIDSTSYVEGSVVTVLFDYIPSKAGHTFLGWATNSSATTPEFVNGGANTFTIGTSDVTLYAVWRNDTANVRIDSASDTMVLYPDTSFYQTMDFYVVVDGLAPVDSIAVVPSFDSSVLEFVSSEWLMTADLQAIEAGTLRSVSAWSEATDVNGNVYKITLRAIAETASTTVGATVMVQDDDGLRTLPVVAKNITITSCPHASFTITTHDGAQHLATCDVCGYNELRAHNENATWETDGTNHWHTCVDCGAIIDSTVTAHTPDTAWVSDGVNHWHTCTVCNAVVDSTFVAHNPEAGYTTDGVNHWKVCVDCGTIVDGTVVAHTPDTAWTSDGVNHWHTCTECGAVVDASFSAHNPNSAWETDGTNHWHTCADCGTIVDSTVAPHTAGTEWYDDDDNHWHLCTDCGIAVETAPHEYDNDLDAFCNVCEHRRILVGDLEDDLDVDSDDAIYLLFYTIYGDTAYPLNQPCDFDNDGDVDSDDAIYLLYHTYFGSADYPLVH